MKLSRIVIKVKDYRKSFEFYKNVMGLKMLSSWQRKDSWGALFAAGSGIIEIIWFPSGEGLDECNYVLEKDKIVIDLETADVEIWHRRLVGAGANVIDKPHDVPWGFHLFTVKDPDGVSLIIGQPLTQK